MGNKKRYSQTSKKRQKKKLLNPLLPEKTLQLKKVIHRLFTSFV